MAGTRPRSLYAKKLADTPRQCHSHIPQRLSPIPAVTHRVYLGSANIGSLRPRLDRLILELSRINYVIFCLQETHLHSMIQSQDISIDGFSVIRLDRVKNGNNGGGVALFIHDSVPFRPFSNPPSSALEAFGCSILIAGISYAVFSVYRPPGQCAAVFREWLDLLLDYVSQCVVPGQPTFLCGDINVDRTLREAVPFLTVLESLNLSPIPVGPTHDRREIDYIASSPNVPGVVVELADPLEPSSLGHKVLCASFPIAAPPHPPRPPPTASVIWHRADWPRMCYMIQYHYGTDVRRDLVQELQPALQSPINVAWERILDLLLSVFYSCVPVKHLATRRHPWITSSLRTLISDTHAAFTRSSYSPHLKALYHSLRNKRNKAVVRAKALYANRLLDRARTPRSFWASIRSLRGQPAAPSIPTLFANDVVYSTDAEKADIISTTLLGNYNPTVSFPRPFPDAPTPHDALASLEFVEYHLGILKTSSTPGIDGLYPRFLKVCRFAVAPLIHAFINAVLQKQCIPSQWRLGRVTPISKRDAHASDPSSYRPITILPVCSKIYESYLLELLGPYLECHVDQYGFSPSCGTEDAAFRLQERIAYYRSLSPSPRQIVIVSLDLRKAFDTIQYSQIIAVLSNRGCPKWILNLVLDFLSCRHHVVRVGTHLSQQSPIPSGVPQGSRIAPFLFNVAINDLLQLPRSTYTSICMYADDCIIVKPIFDSNDIVNLQSDVDRVITHIHSIYMDINAKKSSVFIIKQSRSPLIDARIAISGVNLSESPTLRYLGFHLDPVLSFQHHWTLTVNKARSQLGALYSVIKRFSVPGLLPLVYQRCILPGLLYGLPVCIPGNHALWAKLEGVHLFAARLTLRIHSRKVRATALYKLLGWSSIREIAAKRALLFMLRCSVFNRRFCIFLSCMVTPPPLACLRSRPFTYGQYLISPTGTSKAPPLLPLTRMLMLWNRCIGQRSCVAPSDIEAFITSQAGHNLL